MFLKYMDKALHFLSDITGFSTPPAFLINSIEKRIKKRNVSNVLYLKEMPFLLEKIKLKLSPLKDHFNKHERLKNLLRSIFRRQQHNNHFGIPQAGLGVPIPKQLALPQNKNILQTILSINADAKCHYVIPHIVSHWTTERNLRSMIKTGVICSSEFLEKNKIRGDQLGLSSGDIANLDKNVICFSGGGFVDPAVYYQGWDHRLMRVRIDLSKVKSNGKFNTEKSFHICL